MDATPGMHRSAADEALDDLLKRFGIDEGGHVGRHRVAHAAALGSFQRFEQQAGQALHADAADQFHRTGRPRFIADDLDLHAVGRNQIAKTRGSTAAGEQRRLDAVERHCTHDGSVDKVAAPFKQRSDAFDGFDADGIGIDINVFFAKVTFDAAQRRQRGFARRQRNDQIGLLAQRLRRGRDFDAVHGGEYA